MTDYKVLDTPTIEAGKLQNFFKMLNQGYSGDFQIFSSS